jgi:anti-sigma factor RsiW
MIQSYADGELSLEMMETLRTHISACAACADALREVEQETAIMTTAFAPEMSMSVPTARLRERLDAAIAGLQTPVPAVTVNRGASLRAWLGSLFAPLSFAPGQHAISFASLAAAAIAFALIFSAVFFRRAEGGPAEQAQAVKAALPVAISIPELKAPEATAVPVEEKDIHRAGVVAVNNNRPQRSQPRIERYREEDGAPVKANDAIANKQPAPMTPKDTFLPGERSYLTAIASLTTTLETSEGGALKPSLRAEYERNLAVVDQAIEVTRLAARSNPRDEDAATFLLAAYQSKVDLLNTVADQARFNASAR